MTTALDWLGMIVYEGPETRHFLQGQLSCDTEKLGNDEWTWGGYLTVKGRLLSTFVAIGLGDESVGLVMDRLLIPATLKKLRMYQLRANTKASEDSRRWSGLVGDKFTAAEGKVDRNAGGADFVVPLGGGVALALEAGHAADAAADAAFQVACARQGLPWLTAQLQEQLTAHMISLDLAGGVDFEKGCYLGQEIVIRSHHRGLIKKRSFIVEGEGAAPERGAQVLSEVHGGQAAGQFIYGASENGGCCGLATLRKDAVEGTLELEDGRELSAKPPPYGLFDPKFEKN